MIHLNTTTSAKNRERSAKYRDWDCKKDQNVLGFKTEKSRKVLYTNSTSLNFNTPNLIKSELEK